MLLMLVADWILLRSEECRGEEGLDLKSIDTHRFHMLPGEHMARNTAPGLSRKCPLQTHRGATSQLRQNGPHSCHDQLNTHARDRHITSTVLPIWGPRSTVNKDIRTTTATMRPW